MNAAAGSKAFDRDALRRLRLFALVEGATLVVLVVVAVPLKHLFDMPGLVTIMGPVHGTAFIAFLWALIAAVSTGGWKRRDIARLAIGSVIPFAGLVNERWLARRERALAASPASRWTIRS